MKIKKTMVTIGALVFTIFYAYPQYLKAEENVKEFFVVTTDYQSGSCSVVNLESYSAEINASTLNSDAISKFHNRKIYIINRLGADNITVFSPPNYSTPVFQFSTGNGTNPHDIAFLDEETAYITLYEKDFLLVVNPQTGTELFRIDLSSYTDMDGIPEMDRIIQVKDTMFITLQRLDRNNYFEPTEYSSVLVFDPKERIILKEVRLAAHNPIDMYYATDLNKIVVAETGSYMDSTDGGLETIDLNSYEAEGIQISEELLGGNLGGAFSTFVLKNDGVGYVIVQDDDWNTRIVNFNLIENEVLDTIHTPEAGFVHADLSLVEELLLIADRTIEKPGIRIFDTLDNSELTNNPINVGLPPFCITPIIEESTTTEPCPLEIAMDGEPSSVFLIRWWRDSFLNSTDQGRQLAAIYYKHAEEISSIVVDNLELKMSIAQSLKKRLPTLMDSLIYKKMEISKGHIKEIVSILNSIERNASSSLKKDIRRIKHILNSHTILNSFNVQSVN